MKYLLILITALYSVTLNAQIVNIPDANFKNTLLNYTPIIDTNSDGEIQETEAAVVTFLDIRYNNIIDVTGIASFTSLQTLSCGFNEIIELDLSANTLLTTVSCNNNEITMLNLGANTNLGTFSCSNNSITALNLSLNTALAYVRCGQNMALETLNVENLSNLTQLYFNNTSITTINLTDNTLLQILNCKQSLLTELDLTNNNNLTHLECYQTRISTSLDLAEKTQLISIKCFSMNLGNSVALTLPQGSSLLEVLECGNNLLNSIDVSNFPNLTKFYCTNNNLSIIDVTQNTQLVEFGCGNNNLFELDVNQNTALTFLGCSNNLITSLDLTENTSIKNISINGCNNLLELYLKNGNNQELYELGNHSGLMAPNLKLVCLDRDGMNFDLANAYRSFLSPNLVITNKCNAIKGNIKLDTNTDGCDVNDDALFYVKVNAANGTDTFGTFTQANGDYTLYIDQGTFEINSEINSSFISNPLNYIYTFDSVDEIQENTHFCITTNPDESTNDLSVSTMFTYGTPRPGYESNFRIIFKNEGDTVASGIITLNYDSTMLSIANTSEVISSQTSTSLTFDYSSLNPLETRVIDVVFDVAQPPTATAGDVLHFNTTINPTDNDATPNNNTSNHNVTLVDSFDPNDISLLRRPLDYNDIDEFLHYRIRFQNEGTAEAINITVINELETKLDWSTFQLENSSHDVRVGIVNESDVTYNFEGINLPDSTTDEIGSHGFIAFKIKAKSDILIGDVINSQAFIYFDYNAAVPTNVESTEVVDTAAVANYNNDSYYSVYPNPTNDKLHIKTNQQVATVEVYNSIGKLLLSNINQNSISIVTLTNGLYFIKITDRYGNISSKKVIKE